MRGNLAATLVLLWALGPGVPAAAERDTPLAVGDRAPDFRLNDQRGKPVTLSALLGQRDFVVLAFYIKADTPG